MGERNGRGVRAADCEKVKVKLHPQSGRFYSGHETATPGTVYTGKARVTAKGRSINIGYGRSANLRKTF